MFDPTLPLEYLQDRWFYSPDSHGPSPAEYEQLMLGLMARVAELETAVRFALQFRIGDPTGRSWFGIRQELERVLENTS